MNNNFDHFDNLPRVVPPRAIQLRLPLARPWLSRGALGLIILVFSGQIASQVLFGFDVPLALGGKVNDLILDGQWWRLVTPMFLHVTVTHIAFNAYALYVLGPEVEAWYGASRFATIYLLAGIAGNVMSFAFNPHPSAGASTALFGLIATELVFFYRNRDKFGVVGQRRLTNIIMIIVINVILGLSSESIDNFGHLGGLVGGAAVGWWLCPQYEIEPAGPNGLPRVVDRNSLHHAWRGVVLVALAIVAIVYVAILTQT